MIRSSRLIFLATFIISANAIGQRTESKENSMIRHTVVFSLKYPGGSAEEKQFLDAAKKLASLPGVHHFECLRQISKKNKFDFGLSMEFDSMRAYTEYTHAPQHTSFVSTYWVRDVKDFLELDFEPFNE